MTSTDLAGATQPPLESAQSDTPGDFAARWNAMPEAGRQAFMRAMRSASDRAAVCDWQHGYVQFERDLWMYRAVEAEWALAQTLPWVIEP